LQRLCGVGKKRHAGAPCAVRLDSRQPTQPRSPLRLIGFVLALAVSLSLAPLAVQAQTGKAYRVAILEPFSTAEARRYREAFVTAMRELGYLEGSNVIFDLRTSDPDMVRLPALVDELIALKPDVLVGEEIAARLMRAKTTSIPIVLPGSIDPVGAGLAQSLRRPGMNVTGVALLLDELPVKHISIVREILPRLARVGMFVDTTSRTCQDLAERTRQATRSVGMAFVPYHVANRGEIERAFSGMGKERPNVLLPCPAPMLFNNRTLLFESAVRLRIPFTSFVVANVPLGVLFAYSASFVEGYQRAATYVDKILKGAKPGDLPIEQPTKFELVINLKTAKAFGLKIPQSVLGRADQVIE
jgi:putative tryptophan/tyrosine transport system substrate-binding protein